MLWPKDWLAKTCIMGVLNITPDSFSDGGICIDPKDALRQASNHLRNGADVLDLGPQSTRPGSDEVGPEEELKRLMPVLRLIRSNFKDALISVDTYWSEVAEASLQAGANWINDVTGGRRDPNMFNVIANANCPYVLMHSRGTSKTMDSLTSYEDVVNDVREELLIATEKSLIAGVKPDKLIWDPGIGFAKNTHQNISLLNNLEVLSSEGFPLLVGYSRKRFIGEVLGKTDPIERIYGGLAVVCRCSQASVSIVRVHDVNATHQTLLMADLLWPSINDSVKYR